MGGDLFYCLGFFDLSAALVGLGFGQVEAGDLEAVEEEASAAGIDVVGCDAAEDFDDGGLEGGRSLGSVTGRSKVERRPRRARGFCAGLRVVWW